MRNIIVIVFLAAVILVGAIWYYSGKNQHADQARQSLTSAASQTKEFVQDKFGTSNLSADNIKDEMARTGQVIREKAQQ
ncbi:MAG TPA: hypothetical protein VG754_05260, partial [Verrucomicrobiae bacterium]|nr:hypothetical protein [Verrucomicrobiae bacterium]